METLFALAISILGFAQIFILNRIVNLLRQKNETDQAALFQLKTMNYLNKEHNEIYKSANAATTGISNLMQNVFERAFGPDIETSTLEDLEKEYQKAMDAGDIEKAIELGRMIDRKKNNQ